MKVSPSRVHVLAEAPPFVKYVNIFANSAWARVVSIFLKLFESDEHQIQSTFMTARRGESQLAVILSKMIGKSGHLFGWRAKAPPTVFKFGLVKLERLSIHSYEVLGCPIFCLKVGSKAILQCKAEDCAVSELGLKRGKDKCLPVGEMGAEWVSSDQAWALLFASVRLSFVGVGCFCAHGHCHFLGPSKVVPSIIG